MRRWLASIATLSTLTGSVAGLISAVRPPPAPVGWLVIEVADQEVLRRNCAAKDAERVRGRACLFRREQLMLRGE